MKVYEKRLLSFLSKECKNNGYNVIDKKDILLSFDKKSYVDENDIDCMIQSLERQGYIKIKYEDDNVFCLCVLANNTEEKKESHMAPFSLFLLNLFGAFIGSFFASMLVRILFNV